MAGGGVLPPLPSAPLPLAAIAARAGAAGGPAPPSGPPSAAVRGFRRRQRLRPAIGTGQGQGPGWAGGWLPGLGGSVDSGRAPRVCGRQGREGRAGVPLGSRGAPGGGWREAGAGGELHGALPERLPAGRCPGLCRACARLHLREATGLAQGCFYFVFLRRGWEGRW